MKLHRLALRNYKGIQFVALEPRETGVTIVEGDNEAGKSSIAEAIWLIFEQNDDSSSLAVRNLKPVGRDSATEIELDVSSGPYRFVYSKRFHRSPRTELLVTAPRRETLSGREAHNRARQILDETIDRALWEALRIQQGASLEPIAPGQHQSLLGALDVAAGELLGGPREQTLFDRARVEYERCFTPSGREKAAGDAATAPGLRRSRDAALAEADAHAESIAALEERAMGCERLTLEIAALEAEHEQTRDRRRLLSAQVDDRRALVSALESASAKVTLLESARSEAASTMRTLHDSEAAIVPRRAALLAETAALAELAPLLEGHRADVERASSARDSAQTELNAAKAAVLAAESDVEVARRVLQADQMAERLERIERHEPDLRQLAKWLNECRIDRRSLQAIEAAETERSRLVSLRDAEGASIEVASLNEVTIEIDGRPAQVSAERPVKGKVPGETTLTLPGGITVRVRAGAHAREVEEQLTRASSALQTLLTQAGVESVDAARDLSHERVAIEERRRNLAESVKGDLRDLSADDLRQKLSRERQAIAEATGTRVDLPGLEQAKERLEALRIAASRAGDAVTVAFEQFEAAREELAACEAQNIHHQERVAALGEEITRAESELARLAERGTKEQLGQRLIECESALDAGREALAAARRALDAAPDASEELSAATAELARIEAALRRARELRAGDTAVLEEAGAQGLHGKLTAAEQRAAYAEEELEAYVRRAAAARLLFETLRCRRDEARENYSEPFRLKLESLGQVVFGPSFAVELNDDLSIARVGRDGITLEVGQLSVGVREQLSVLTRLACAALVSANGAPVVLDDVFGWADPKRLQDLGPILAQAAGEGQVLVFTCTPARFATVAPARVIALPGGRVTERAAAAEEQATSLPESESRRRVSPPVTVSPAKNQPALDLFAEAELSRSPN